MQMPVMTMMMTMMRKLMETAMAIPTSSVTALLIRAAK